MADDREDRARDLAHFANAGAQSNQPMPSGHALVRPTTGLADRIVGAQPVAVYRDEAKILQKLTALAAAAGTDWFYRFPVRKKDGGQDWIEGPSIKLANDVARIFGNNINEVREIDVGDAWIFYARFTDIETGFSMERAYRQRKTQTSLKTKDADRQLDIAYQIGQSKSIRGAICNALQIYCDFALDEARNSLVNKIGKDLANWRARTLQGIAKIPVELLRVERVMGRSAKDWLAPDVAQVIAMMKSIADGMASADEVFPPIQTKEEAAAQQGRQEQGGQSPAMDADTTATAGSAARTTDQPAQAPGAAAQETRVAEGAQAKSAAPSTTGTPEAAHARGVEDRRKGMSRKAVPPEWRTAEHTALAAAWLRGFDSQS